MIDLHCHILPGVDDGADTVEDSIAMAKVALDQGITHILCTPHHNNGKYNNPKNEVINRVKNLQKEFDKRDIPLTVMPGQEVHITGELVSEIKKDNILYTDLQENYVLVEFPSNDIPEYTERLFFEIQALGKTPVIVHPERNAKFIHDPNLLIDYLDSGCLAQLTAPSYVGKFGSKIQKTAYKMVKHNLVQMIASDAHGVDKRNFYMKEATDKITKDFSRRKVMRMNEVAREIANGDIVTADNYTPVKTSKNFLSLFKKGK